MRPLERVKNRLNRPWYPQKGFWVLLPNLALSCDDLIRDPCRGYPSLKDADSYPHDDCPFERPAWRIDQAIV